MIRSLLVANRGEIAVRIIRACKELGIRTVAVYSEADRQALHVKMADQAICIGPPPSKDSYLNISNIISAALHARADAIHPGVGFLSENAEFARQVQLAGLVWVGPDPQAIEMLGDKVSAKANAKKYGVPCTPGLEGAVTNIEKTVEAVRDMGLPVIIKASAGGGGKGMRVVRKVEDLADNIRIASSEAEKSFGDGTVFIEKYLENAAHVELQMIGDKQGNVIYLGERDCSVQRNHQKLVEESPSPLVTPEIRRRMGEDAVRLFKGIGYFGAGTIEFLFKDGQYYFMEVNSRIQVEHPVTEMITNVDLIKEMIRVANGEPLSVKQEDIRFDGYAMEIRINATAPGTVKYYLPPSGFKVRVDSFLYTGYKVPPTYDSMVAKVIIGAPTRAEGINKMLSVLSEFELDGVPTNLESQKKIINTSIFRKGGFGTNVLDAIMKEIG
ncbi:MAG: acetyl-CoA carboxylase biotin carboxylase subunit [Spirochaetales bacterium]|nr:acetyl-CoA carboxylase biotin carboxylase subunit [Spirochaetales bacterium]